MDKVIKTPKLNKNRNLCIAVTVVFIVSYTIVRLIEILTTPTRIMSFSLAGAMVLAVMVCIALLYKTNNSFFGLLAAIMGYKMMPPPISMMTQKSVYGAEAYYLFSRLAMIAFVVMIIRFYFMQSDKNKINALTILSLMFVVPFFVEISDNSEQFFLIKTGSMLGYYFFGFACYIIASLIILVVSYKCGYHSMRFAAYFEFAALGINALKRIAAIIATTVIKGNHISRSYYVWIAIYIALIGVFWFAKNRIKKQ